MARCFITIGASSPAQIDTAVAKLAKYFTDLSEAKSPPSSMTDKDIRQSWPHLRTMETEFGSATPGLVVPLIVKHAKIDAITQADVGRVLTINDNSNALYVLLHRPSLRGAP